MSWRLRTVDAACVRCEFDEVPYKARPRMTKAGRAYTPAKTRRFERRIREAWRSEYGDRFAAYEGPVRVIVRCTRPLSKSSPKGWVGRCDTSRPDADNRLKCVLDALNGVAWKDDAQATGIAISYRPRTPYGTPVVLEVYVKYLEEEQA